MKRERIKRKRRPFGQDDKIKRLAIIAMFSDDDLMEKLVLKGGNAIDLIHKSSVRASVDLDFSMEREFVGEESNIIAEKIDKILKDTFRANGFEVFDFTFRERPPEVSHDMADFWGGYRVEFKIIEVDEYKKLEHDLRKLRLNAIEVGLPFNKKKIFIIDISKFEYCTPRQEHELEGYTIFVYTPEMIVIEKIRAICQQMPEYAEVVRSPSRRARAKDFFDIYILSEHFKINLISKENVELLINIFDAKKVPFALIGRIGEYREYHRLDFPSVQATVNPNIELKGFDFYFDYVVEKCRELKILWEI